MTESLLEILRILTYLSVALISLVIATYTISVSYLGRETHRSLWRKKTRRDELRRKLRKLGQKIDVKGIEKEIDVYKKEISELDSRLFYLSVYGAVIAPSVLGVIALVFTSYNIYMNPPAEMRNLLVLGAVMLIAGGFFCLIKTLFAVDWVASRIPLPKFEISFEANGTIKKYRAKEQKNIVIDVHNTGEDVAEDLEIYVGFPPVFYLPERARQDYTIVPQGSDMTHPNYTAAIFEISRIHIDIIQPIGVLVTMPDKEGLYTIPVDIYERKSGESRHELTLEIIE